MRRRLLVEPHVPKDGSNSPDLVMDNPLSQNPGMHVHNFLCIVLVYIKHLGLVESSFLMSSVSRYSSFSTYSILASVLSPYLFS